MSSGAKIVGKTKNGGRRYVFLAAIAFFSLSSCQSLSRSCRRRKAHKRCFERISNRFAIGLVALLVFGMSACQSLKRAAAPVVVFDAKIAERECLGVEFVAVNLSGRPIQSAAFYASVAEKEDGGGEDGSGDFGSDGGAFSEAYWTLRSGLEPGAEEVIFIPLEGLDDSVEADGLEIESVVVESAVFEGGERWMDRN